MFKFTFRLFEGIYLLLVIRQIVIFDITWFVVNFFMVLFLHLLDIKSLINGDTGV